LSNVELSSSFELQFDRFLWPKTVTRQAICLAPSTVEITKFEDCAEPGQPFTQPEYDPATRRVTYRLARGERLAPATQYRLTVFANATTESAGFLAFDGAPLGRSYTFDFVTNADATSSVDEPSPSAERYCAAQACAKSCSATRKQCRAACTSTCAGEPTEEARAACESACRTSCDEAARTCKAPCECLDGPECAEDGDLIGEKPYLFRGCGFSPCHATSTNPEPRFAAPAPMGLDLSSPGAVAATAIGVTARLSQHGEAAALPDRSGNRFGRAMPLIDPSNPGNSFLLYKLIINARNYEAPSLGGGDDEFMRLRSGAIAGMPMPAALGPDTNQLGPDARESERELRIISAWIAAGAVLECPPGPN